MAHSNCVHSGDPCGQCITHCVQDQFVCTACYIELKSDCRLKHLLATCSFSTFGAALMREYSQLSDTALNFSSLLLCHICTRQTSRKKLNPAITLRLDNVSGFCPKLSHEFSSFAEQCRLVFNIELRLSINVDFASAAAAASSSSSSSSSSS